MLLKKRQKLDFTEEDRPNIWKEHIKKIMNEENKWHQNNVVETDVVERSVEKVTRNEIVEAMQKIKSGKTTGPFEVSMKMVVARGEIGGKVMMVLCQLQGY